MDPLVKYRTKIDAIDTEIIELLARRFEVVKSVGEYKKQNNLPSLQPNRWQEVLESRMKIAKDKNLDRKFICDIWNMIHKFALSLEEKVK